MEPRTLAQMTKASSLHRTREAIVETLDRLLVGVTVVGHPGKLDINDVVAKSLVSAPGVAIGWTRARQAVQPGGSFNAIYEFTAYIVAEDYADIRTNKRTGRDEVAHGIGSTILEILADPDLSSWGLTNTDRPDPAQEPALVPMFTAKSYAEGTAYYAVSWRQAVWDEGRSIFGGAIGKRESSDSDYLATAEYDADAPPTEIMAMINQAEANEQSGES